MISKSQSLELKGLAVLFMVVYHLADMVIDKNTSSLITIGQEPLYSFIHNATYPVFYFLILSGYGLAHNYHNGKKGFGYNFTRIAKLYLLYWSVLIVFPIILGQIFAKGHFDFSVTQIIANFTGWFWTWNNHTWFLFPYVLISFLSIFIFKLNERFKPEYIATAILVLSLLCSFFRSRYGNIVDKYYVIYHFILFVKCLFSFQLGVVLYVRRDFFRRMLAKMTSMQSLLAICALFLIKSIFDNQTLNSFYSLIFIVLFLNIKLGIMAKKFLATFGKYSTGIWFIHGYIGVQIFKNEVNQLHYYFLIFLFVAIVSLLCSVVLTYCMGFVNNKLFPKH